MVRCSNCGSDVSPNLKHCPKCGASMESDIIVQGPIKEKKNNKKVLFIDICVVVILVILCVVGYLIYRNKFINNEYIGLWSNTLTYYDKEDVSLKINSIIKFNKDMTFNYNFNDLLDKNNNMNVTGEYKIKRDKVLISYTYEDKEYDYELFIDNDKLCFDEKNCDDYLVKDSSTISRDLVFNSDTSIKKNLDSFFNDIKKDDYVILVIGDTTCEFSKNFKPVVENVMKKYDLNYYWFDINIMDSSDRDKIMNDKRFNKDYHGTPHTLVIKNDEVETYLSGYREMDEFVNFLGGII